MSFVESVKDILRSFPDFVDLDVLLANVKRERRGDYLFPSPNVIMEQKELCGDRRQHIEDLNQAFKNTAEKYYPGLINLPNPENFLDSVDVADKKKLANSLYKITRFVEDDLSSADKQILNTKELLNRKDAGGLLMLVNERAGHIPPQFIAMAINRFINQVLSDGSQRFKHVDGVVCLQLFDGFRISGKDSIISYQSVGRSVIVDSFAGIFAEKWSRSLGSPLVVQSGISSLPLPDGTPEL